VSTPIPNHQEITSMKTFVCVLPAAIANPTAGVGAVACADATTIYQLDGSATGQGSGISGLSCLTAMGSATPYAADLNGPSGGFSSGAIAILDRTANGNFWVKAVAGWQSVLTSTQVNQQGPSSYDAGTVPFSQL
jgi:hypothetical protein